MTTRETARQPRMQAVALVRDLLSARRGGNVAREQRAHIKLTAFCLRHRFDMEQVIDEGRRYLAATSVAAVLNGWVDA